ncbi:MAG TPA: magnesium/cobalt transporter CorA [Abditibacteriaceae bacterium]|jgi:magnesium transporter
MFPARLRQGGVKKVCTDGGAERYNHAVIFAYLYNRNSNKLSELDAAAVLATAPEPAEVGDANKNGSFVHTRPRCREGELLWIDITAPDEADYHVLQERFHLHPMVIEDLKSREDRPKLHDYGEYIYIIFHAIRLVAPEALDEESPVSTRDALHLDEIDCLVGPDYVVTLHAEPVAPFNDLRERWHRRPELMQSGAGYLLYELMDEVLDEYFPVLDLLDERIDDFEDRLFQEFQEHLSADIFSLKRCLLQIRRVAGPTRDVANVLLRRDAESGGKHFAYFQDLYDHAVRIVDMVDSFRELLSGALDAYLAMASNRTNAIMKTLTSASIILLVPTLIAGIYGMNFDNMPELHTRYGYYIALGLMGFTIAGLSIYFKRRQWL